MLQTASFIMSIGYYLSASLFDPGYMPKRLQVQPEEVKELKLPAHQRFCKPCKSWKPCRAAHCSVCDKCVFKMDHHCVWINNCVGVNNSKAFLQFVTAAFVYNASFAATCVIACLNVIGYMGSPRLLNYAVMSDFQMVGDLQPVPLLPVHHLLRLCAHLRVLHLRVLRRIHRLHIDEPNRC